MLPGLVAWAQIVSGSLSNTPRTPVEIGRDATGWSALWATYGTGGSPPAVDFESDMVVVISALVQGPGAFPPAVQVSGVTGSTAAARIDGYLAGCEWGVCPGAPGVPCRTATPYQVLRVTAADTVQAVQGPTLGVCP